MDRVGLKILPKVTAKLGENPNHLKPKGLPAMLVSWRLVGPKGALNRSTRKGKPLIFGYHGDTCGDASQFSDASG